MQYGADGTLLQRKYLKDGVQISKRDYLRGKEYKSDIPESVHHEDVEGVILKGEARQCFKRLNRESGWVAKSGIS